MHEDESKTKICIREIEMKQLAFSNLVLGIVLIVGAVLVSRLLPDWRWSHHPVHAVVEGLGAFIALIVASLIVLLLHYKRISSDPNMVG